ncbi:hypothetical protein [Bacillus sp. EB01]|uniref:hypothetical protein n=1 Tax=Bacillus sp. EB01 TaxID=1347086 RepID=UPI000694552A|nr:hypothetical protein [Bacillus sp. EB01]
MTEIFIHIAVPIEKPFENYIKNFKEKDAESFMFDQPERFILFERIKEGPEVFLARDDHGQWYFMSYFTSSKLTGLKWARQSAPPSYVEKDVKLPLVELLREEGLKAANSGFDKAFAHVGAFTSRISEVQAHIQARLANVDGEDDPTVVTNIHFIKNLFNGLETRYVAGAETYSFATVTENEEYFKDVHLNSNAYLYLLYFVYFTNYQIVPSNQMVPRLLGNLWASKQALNCHFNSSLFVSEPLDKKA